MSATSILNRAFVEPVIQALLVARCRFVNTALKTRRAFLISAQEDAKSLLNKK
jgi:hypothetical protein